MGLTGRRILGAALVAGAYVPLHRLLAPTRAGPAGENTRDAAEAAWLTGLYGTVAVAGAAVVLTLVVPEGAPGRLVARISDALARPSRRSFAIGAGLVAGTLSLAAALHLYHGLPTSVDEMAQLLHAQALTEGRLSVPVPGDEAAWSIQNGLVTDAGWASIYPPFHTLLLALGLLVGAPWIVGPGAVGVATWASTLSFEELLGTRPGRIAGALLAVSPFWLLLGATYLSQTSAAACIALVLWTGLRAREGGLGWALASGVAVGAAVTSRPWIGLVSSATLLTVLWWPRRDRAAARLGALLAGGLPFAGLLFWWNAGLFGSPVRLGYSAAYGPRHGLGLHVDPWGNVYGAREGLGYTGADLAQLGAHLLETPLPAVAVVGVALLFGMRARGTHAYLAWVVAALAANGLYWHHGIHMGPRMLYETVPAWVGLVVASAAFLTGDAVARPHMRRAVGWGLAAAGLTALALVPGVVSSASRSPESVAYATAPAPPGEEPALVFVHGSWASRVVARLSAAGMRRDSVETALRRNDICTVDRYARWRASDPASRGGRPPTLDLRALPGTPPHLHRTLVSPGNDVWTEPGAPRDERCLRDALADRFGTVDLEPLLWQGPPFPERDLVLARDMGPEANARVRAALAGRDAFLLLPPEAGASRPRLLEYEEAIGLLWTAPDDPAP